MDSGMSTEAHSAQEAASREPDDVTRVVAWVNQWAER
jgi:hypothetical protein